MPKLFTIPRLSIVVPFGSDQASFESTLVSVLENRPAGCEVIVAHDGSYDDPFELSDEVRFVVGSSSWTLDLIADGASQARGRFVHVLAEGMLATDGWADAALHRFEHQDAGIVSPVIRHQATRRIVAAGWADSSARLCHPVAQGASSLDRRESSKLDGAYVQASFWRRELLRSLPHTLRTNDLTEAMYAHTLSAKGHGWKTVLAPECDVLCTTTQLTWDVASFGRGTRLRAIHDLVTGQTSNGLATAFKSFLCNVARPSLYGEALGQATKGTATQSIRKRLDLDAIDTGKQDSKATIKLPTATTQAYRAAA